MQADAKQLKRYLLGDLPGGDADAIDLQIITDETFCEDISLAESNLIEDHLEGALSADEEKLFHANFMISDSRHEHLGEIQLIKKAARSPAAQKKQPDEETRARAGFFDFVKAWLRPLAFGAAVVALLVAGLFWFGYLGGSGSGLEKQYAELNKRDLGNSGEIAGYSNLSLIPGAFRGGDSVVRQSGDKLTDSVLFRLMLTSQVDAASFKAKVLRGTATIFTLESVKAYQNPGGQEVRMLLPKSILQKGQYQIKLENSAGADAGSFTFVIE